MSPLRQLGSVPFLVAACAALLALCLVAGGGSVDLLGALPAVGLLALLLIGRYPGEELIHRLGAQRRRRIGTPDPLATPHFSSPGAYARIAHLAVGRPLRGPPAPAAIRSLN